jgi:hypothetical protein
MHPALLLCDIEDSDLRAQRHGILQGDVSQSAETFFVNLIGEYVVMPRRTTEQPSRSPRSRESYGEPFRHNDIVRVGTLGEFVGCK